MQSRLQFGHAFTLPSRGARTLDVCRGRSAPPRLAAAAGAAVLGYGSLIERNAFTLRRFDVPVLAPGTRSDAGAARLRPAHHRAAAPQAALDPRSRPARTRPGRQHRRHLVRRRTASRRSCTRSSRCSPFPARSSPATTTTTPPSRRTRSKYFFPDRQRVHGTALPWPSWPPRWPSGLDRPDPCARHRLPVEAGRRRPGRHRRPAPASARATTASPARPIRPRSFASASRTRPSRTCSRPSPRDGYDLVLAGHTHGGQVRDPVRTGDRHQLRHRRAPGPLAAPSGTSTCTSTSAPAWARTRIAPIRIACRPEASLLTLVPRTHLIDGRRSPRSIGCETDRYAGPVAHGVWRSLVARFVRDEEAVGSNPATPTPADQREFAPFCRGH